MSRYSLPPRTDAPGIYEVAVGWDRQLGTYFVIVFGPPDADGEPEVALWRGTAPAEITDPCDAITLAASYASIPDGLVATLQMDRIKSSAPAGGALQILTRLLITNCRIPPLIGDGGVTGR
jgi:hypothetical protein